MDLLSLAGVVNDGLVVFVRAVGEVHANDIKTGLAELVDGHDRVGLGANGADDGGPTVVPGGLEFGVELGEPGNLGGAGAEVVKSGRHLESRKRDEVVRMVGMVRGSSTCEKERKVKSWNSVESCSSLKEKVSGIFIRMVGVLEGDGERARHSPQLHDQIKCPGQDAEHSRKETAADRTHHRMIAS